MPADAPRPADPQADVAEGIEHLQSAAREMIKAARSLLDAAEGVVEDRGALQQVAGTLQGLAGAASTWLRTANLGGEAGGDGDGSGKVQRIDLS